MGGRRHPAPGVAQRRPDLDVAARRNRRSACHALGLRSRRGRIRGDQGISARRHPGLYDLPKWVEQVISYNGAASALFRLPCSDFDWAPSCMATLTLWSVLIIVRRKLG